MTPFRILRTAKLSCLRSDGCGPSSGQVRTHEFYAESQQLRTSGVGWLHELPGGLGDAAGQRRVDGERVRDLVDGELLLHGERDAEYELARHRRDDHAAEHDP